MINVDRIYQRVLTLANKEQRGYITPQEFNLFANQAQMDIFEQYFYDLNQFIRTPGNDTVHADMVDMLEEKIGVFEETQNLPLTLGQGSLDNLGRFYRFSEARTGGTNTTLEKVSKKDLRLFLNSPLTIPTINRPICIVEEENNIIRVTPNTITNIDVDYIQSPRLVNWTYVVVQGKALYNNSAADAQDFSLHPSEETELVLKILTLAGFTLKDPALYQAASGEDIKNIQQEKQ